MLELVGTGITTVVGWIGSVITAIFTETGALAELAPLVAVGISISAILLAVKIIKTMVWGS